jgi:hypothetical protein
MPHPIRSRSETWSASLLRRDLSARADHLARTQNLLHDIHPGSEPIVIFGRNEDGRHGNFHPASDAAICANPSWLRRLTKPHTASRRSRARNDWQWMELDSCNSSDALLMNIFCHPGVFNGTTLTPAVANLLNVELTAQPCFGINPAVPLKNIRKGRASLPSNLAGCANPLKDRTEIDLQLNNLYLEAKLTESNFQTTTPRLIERYRDLETIFDIAHLPRNNTGAIQGYQLIRNVLAAFASEASFCVLCDARRHDLIEIWYSVLSAVHSPIFATRLKLLAWQELATILPKDLQQFLEAKYGILPV